MEGRELIQATLNHRNNSGNNGIWLGNPTYPAMENYYRATGICRREKYGNITKGEEPEKAGLAWRGGSLETDFYKELGCEIVRLSPEHNGDCWKHPEGVPMWNCFTDKRYSLNTGGVFRDCEKVKEVENFPWWPDPNYLDFSRTVEDAKYAYEQGMVVFGSMVSGFFHVLCDFFGMEDYFVKMYTNPDVVHAVTRHVVDFYLETNRRFIKAAKPYISGGFFSNDLGTQLAPLVGAEKFDEFILPYLRELIAPFKEEGLKFVLHSCGSIDQLIPRLIDAGVDILNPMQAKAVGMDAENLSKKYGGKLVFMGGVDAQELLPFGTPAKVREEVLRLRDIYKGDLIISPSHDCLLPDVPFENVMAMIEAAKE